MNQPISAETRLAYQQAKYVVDLDGEVELRVDQTCEQLDRWLQHRQSYQAAFITPENPSSQHLNSAENSKRHQLILADLEKQKLDFVEGYGVDDDETWPREHSYLVLVDGQDQAEALARKYQQNAYLLCKLGQPVKLICLS
jgi:hypothetical protein